MGLCPGDEDDMPGNAFGHEKSSKAGEQEARGFGLGQNYPNPFNPSTTISFSLPEATSVQLTVHNALGQVVKVLASSTFGAGVHTATWDATDHSGSRVSTGLYIYRLKAGSHIQTRTMLLLE